MTSVLFVCLGNICRSPTAHAVFTKIAAQAGQQHIEIDSAGTWAWHKGETPDRRSVEAGAARGYSFAGQTARKVETLDFARFDYILAMDKKNLKKLKKKKPKDWTGHLSLFMDFTGRPDTDVPDPYYGGPQGFDAVLDMIEAASRGLIEAIAASQSEGSSPQSGKG